MNLVCWNIPIFWLNHEQYPTEPLVVSKEWHKLSCWAIDFYVIVFAVLWDCKNLICVVCLKGVFEKHNVVFTIGASLASAGAAWAGKSVTSPTLHLWSEISMLCVVVYTNGFALSVTWDFEPTKSGWTQFGTENLHIGNMYITTKVWGLCNFIEVKSLLSFLMQIRICGVWDLYWLGS